MKELYIVRHAKSSWSDPNAKDFDRVLNKRGLSDAPLMGKVLKKRQVVPDTILTSTAKRALLTAQIISKELSFNSDLAMSPDLYHASSSSLMQQLNQVENTINVLMVVGHNPGLTYLAEELSLEHFGNLPTCGVVGIRFEFDSWKMVSGGTGTCFYYDYPKNHK